MHQVYVTSVPLDMGYAWGLDGMVKPELARKLTPEPFTPTWPACLDRKRSIIEQVCEKDVLLMYPYESMDPFVNMLREAAMILRLFPLRSPFIVWQASLI